MKRNNSPKSEAEGSLVEVGGPIDELSVALCIYGEDLDPDELTRVMGTAPTSTIRKDDLSKSGHRARVGKWELQSATPRSKSLEEQIENLLSRVTIDQTAWTELSKRFRIQIWCGLYLDAWNRGDGLSASIMYELGKRGIHLGLDIYGPDDSMPEGLRNMTLPGDN